jgi:hypothetical protein
MSGLGFVMALGGAASIAGAPATCVEVRRDLAAGGLPARADLIVAACPEVEAGAGTGTATRAGAAFRYDAGVGLVRTARALTTGEVVRAPPAALVGGMRPGARLTVATTVGPVRVERQVVVLRAIRGGGLLVRAADGAVFATPEPEAQP